MKIIIPGIPIPKARHKPCRRGNFIHHYDPQNVEKKSLAKFLRSEIEKSYDFTKYLAFTMHILFYFKYPKDYFKWIEPIHNCKPDASNCYKFYEDVAIEIFYEDDKQIVEIYAKKLYSDQPRTEIEIMPLEITDVANDVKKVMKIFDPVTLKSILNDVHTLNIVSQKLDNGQLQSDYSNLLTAAASLLVSFSIKYKDRLCKIAKVGEIPCDLTPYEHAVGEHSTEIY